MIMRKGLQITMMVLLYVAFAVCGFFLQDVLMDVLNHSNTTEISDKSDTSGAQEISPVPVIDKISSPVRDASGKYGFEVFAAVATGDQMIFVVYSDQECINEVAKELLGKFESIPAKTDGKYFVRVQNATTKDYSEIVAVNGLVPLIMYEKISALEIERVCNSGDYGTAPVKFNHRIAPGCQIIPQGMNAEERNVSTVADVCQKVMMGIWESISVVNIEYDSQNRMKKLVIRINY